LRLGTSSGGRGEGAGGPSSRELSLRMQKRVRKGTRGRCGAGKRKKYEEEGGNWKERYEAFREFQAMVGEFAEMITAVKKSRRMRVSGEGDKKRKVL